MTRSDSKEIEQKDRELGRAKILLKKPRFLSKRSTD